jgi:hypothetical protein
MCDSAGSLLFHKIYNIGQQVRANRRCLGLINSISSWKLLRIFYLTNSGNSADINPRT